MLTSATDNHRLPVLPPCPGKLMASLPLLLAITVGIASNPAGRVGQARRLVHVVGPPVRRSGGERDGPLTRSRATARTLRPGRPRRLQHQHRAGREVGTGKLLSPSRRRQCIDHARGRLGISERRACQVLGQHRSTQRRIPHGPDDEDCLVADMIELARRYGRYAYRRIAALLRDAGWQVNDKRVKRLWRREGLKVPGKQPKRGPSSDGGRPDRRALRRASSCEAR